MYKTKKLLKWIDKEVDKYCKYLDIEKPKVVYSAETFVDAVLPFYPHSREWLMDDAWADDEIYGSIDKTYQVLRLNVRDHTTKLRLKETIVHELSHKKLQYNGHAKKLHECIEKTIKNCP